MASTSNMQQTIAREVTLKGVGLHTGKKLPLNLYPLLKITVMYSKE